MENKTNDNLQAGLKLVLKTPWYHSICYLLIISLIGLIVFLFQKGDFNLKNIGYLLLWTCVFQYLMNCFWFMNIIIFKDAFTVIYPFRFVKKLKILKMDSIVSVELGELNTGKYFSRWIDIKRLQDKNFRLEPNWISNDSWNEIVMFIKNNHKSRVIHYKNGILQ